MNLNKVSKQIVQTYTGSCEDFTYSGFLELSGRLVSGLPLDAKYQNIYNQFGPYSNKLADYDEVYYGFIPSNPTGTGIVISQVYVAGGATNAFYNRDYIELYNQGTGAVNLNSWSIQYASAGGTSWQRVNLNGILSGKRYYLIEGGGGAVGQSLPTPDISIGVSFSNTSGKIALKSDTVTLATDKPYTTNAANLIDFVGYAPSTSLVSDYKGSGPISNMSATRSAFRKLNGSYNVNDNKKDYILGIPSPRNRSQIFTGVTLFNDSMSSINRLTVSNAGISSVNGIYSGYTIYDGKTGYQKDNQSQLILWSGNKWNIIDYTEVSNTYFVYYSLTNSEYPWQATNWITSSDITRCHLPGSTPIIRSNFFDLSYSTGINFANINIDSTGITTGFFVAAYFTGLYPIFSPCFNNNIPCLIRHSGDSSNIFYTGLPSPSMMTGEFIASNTIKKLELSTSSGYNLFLSGNINFESGFQFTLSTPGIIPTDILTGKSGTFLNINNSLYSSDCYFTGSVTGSGISYVNLDKAICDAESNIQSYIDSGVSSINCNNCNYQVSLAVPCPADSITKIDPEALTYINKANIKDLRVQNEINNFVIGLKNSNIWEKLDNIWILKTGYNGTGNKFYDLKSGNFTGDLNPIVIASDTGYKMPSLSAFSLNNCLYFPNNPIRFTGQNWTTFFALENYLNSPTNFEILMTNESYLGSGFRMGYPASKSFSLWSDQSVPNSSMPNYSGNGFYSSSSSVQEKPYSFISATLKHNYIGTGSGIVRLDNNPPVINSGIYWERNIGITQFPYPAGGTNTFGNNIAFFAISRQDLSSEHINLQNLIKETIFQNLDQPAAIGPHPSSESPNIITFQSGIASGSIQDFSFSQVYINALESMRTESCENCYYLFTGSFYTGQESANRYNQLFEYCNVTGSTVYRLGESGLALQNLKSNLLDNVSNKALLRKCLEDTLPERFYLPENFSLPERFYRPEITKYGQYIYTYDILNIDACSYCGVDLALASLNKTDTSFAVESYYFESSPFDYRLTTNNGIFVNNPNTMFIITTGSEASQTVIWFSPYQQFAGTVGGFPYAYLGAIDWFKTLLQTGTVNLDIFTGNYSIAGGGGGGGAPATKSAWLNEIHYDNAGTDINEMIEIYTTPAHTFPDNQTYVTYYSINGLIVTIGGGFAPQGWTGLDAFVKTPIAGGVSGYLYKYNFPTNGLINGGGGFCISVGTTWATSTPIEFIAYSGTSAFNGGDGITTAVGPGALYTNSAGQFAKSDLIKNIFGVVVREQSTSSATESLQKTGIGKEFGDFWWAGPVGYTRTPDAINVNQNLGTVTPGGNINYSVIPGSDSQFLAKYGSIQNWLFYANTPWNGIIPKETPMRFYIFNTYTDGVINNNGTLSSYELIPNTDPETFVHAAYTTRCEGCNYRFDEYTGYGHATGQTLIEAITGAKYILDQDVGQYREFNPCPEFTRNKSTFTVSNTEIPEYNGYYSNTIYYGGPSLPPYRTNYVGPESGWVMFQWQMYAAPNRIIFKRNDTLTDVFDTQVGGEQRRPPNDDVNAFINQRSIGINCIYKTSSYDTIKAELIKFETTASAGFWGYKIISRPNDLLTNIFFYHATSTSATGIANQNWTSNWVIPVTYSRKIRVKFQPNPPEAGTRLEEDSLAMYNLLNGGGQSLLMQTGPTLATYNQDLQIPLNATGVRIELTTDALNKNIAVDKWRFGIANSGVNPFA